MHHVNEYLGKSSWFQRHHGQDHLLVASHWASEFYVPRFDNIIQCNMIGWGDRNYGFFNNNHNRVIMPKLYVGHACSHVANKTSDFAMIATMKPNNPAFRSRSDICQWIKIKSASQKSNNNNNTVGGYTMPLCRWGMQCPALANARLGFHFRGDTYGSNRLTDTLLSGTVPIFSYVEQYDVVPDWIDWKLLSYYASVSENETVFLKDIDTIVADMRQQQQGGNSGYDEKLAHVVLNRDLFDWKTPIPFDTYLYRKTR